MVERDEQRLARQDPASASGAGAEAGRPGDELAEARDQLAATSEVLAVIGRGERVRHLSATTPVRGCLCVRHVTSRT